jgi:sec-independent protein translocase protein TatC
MINPSSTIATMTMNHQSEGMNFWQHLNELRKRLLRSALAIIVGFSVAYCFHKEIFRILRIPFDTAYQNVFNTTPKLISISMMEGFMVYLKMSVLVGFFAASPVIFYQLWKFIAPGLRENEKKHVVPFVTLATIFFVGGAVFGYFLVFPKGFEYFLTVTQGENIEPMIQMDQYYRLASWMLVGFGASFEGPLILLYLVFFRILSTKQLINSWRGAMVGILALSAIITPTPDIGTMVMMAVPLMAMYGITILFSIFLSRKDKANAVT